MEVLEQIGAALSAFLAGINWDDVISTIGTVIAVLQKILAMFI